MPARFFILTMIYGIFPRRTFRLLGCIFTSKLKSPMQGYQVVLAESVLKHSYTKEYVDDFFRLFSTFA